MDVRPYLESQRKRIDQVLERLLPPAEGPAGTVARAMRYAVMGGGKRLRPTLMLAAHEACGGCATEVLEAAAALELLHTYSLVHDDLPSMDDDDLRRGRPTLHRAFGEAQAILAGDALLTLTFELLCSQPPGPELAPRRLAAVASAARSAGIAGMIAGQIADLEAEQTAVGLERLHWIHRHKTGALFAASAEIGAIHAGATNAQQAALARYGESLGLAFQVADDILDCTSTREALGKTPGKDRRDAKATFPALLGIEGSRTQAEALAREAVAALSSVKLDTPLFAGLARYAIGRSA